MRNLEECTLRQLTAMAFQPTLRSISDWWWRRAEDHYLICADVEATRAHEAHLNAAYYQKQAALARSARL